MRLINTKPSNTRSGGFSKGLRFCYEIRTTRPEAGGGGPSLRRLIPSLAKPPRPFDCAQSRLWAPHFIPPMLPGRIIGNFHALLSVRRIAAST
jgi:hypothetical protein